MTVADNGHHSPRLLTLSNSNLVTAPGTEATVPEPATNVIAPELSAGQRAGAASASVPNNLPALPTTLPVLWHWLGLLAVGGWLTFTARDASGFVPAIGLLLIAGAARTVTDIRSRRGSVSARLGQAIANGMTLIAVATAGIVATTAINPTLVVLPVVVWTFAANSSTRQMSTAIAASAGLMALLIAGAGIRVNDEPVASALVLAGASALASLAAAWHGKQVATSIMRTATQPTAGIDQPDRAAQLIDEARATIAEQHDPSSIARTGIGAIQRAFRPSYIAVVEAVPDEGIMLPIACHSTLKEDAESFNRRLVNITSGAMAERKPVWMIDDGSDLEAITCRKMDIEGLLIVPLSHLSRQVGAIQIAWEHLPNPAMLSEALAFTTELGRWLTPDLAIAQYATVIEHGYFDAMSSLSATVDGRQRYTRGHSKRVARLALTIAEELRLEEDEQRKLLYAAELHDIGRAGVSDDILGKPGTLTDAELEAIREIPRLSANLVEPVSFFTDVRSVILHQHERWDGSGHPQGLIGAEIPLLSRILAIADAYDAMTSQRPYREALSKREALTQLWRERAGKYDPQIVEVFVLSVEMDLLGSK